MARFFKRCAAVALGLALLFVGLRAGLNYSGFCLEQRRWLTDREKIEIAIKRILASYPPTLIEVVTYPDGRKADRYFQPENPVPYRSVDEFLQVNPECCEVTQREHPKISGSISLGSRLFGITSANVRVRYQVRYLDASGRMITRIMEPYIAISNCGRPLN
ncbi:hypothetical protein [Steroidobacter agaridevorans]|nr:hypothetical protein [Steroidobacter agaridevorans]